MAAYNLCLADFELNLSAFQAYRTNQLKVSKNLIQEIDTIENKNTKNTNFYFTTNSSKFQSLKNVNDNAKLSLVDSIEGARSYLDVVTPSAGTNGGYAVIGDILTRQIEDSLDSSEFDFINVEDDNEEQQMDFSNIENENKKTIPTKEKSEKKSLLLDDYIENETSPFYIVS